MDSPISNERVRSDVARRKQAFQLLSDETRLEILRTLWEAQDSTDTSPMRFAELRDRLGAEDPGRLNYHLNRLTKHFVHRTDEGYELREAGTRIVRVLLAGTAIDDPEIEPVDVDVTCWYCGGQPQLQYRDGWRSLVCTGCDARCVDSFPPGVISRNEFPPSGLLDRTPNEVNEADRIWGAHRRASVMDEVCPECAGHMPVSEIHVCDDHQPDWDDYQFCSHCGSIFWMLVSHVCEVCQYHWKLPTLFYPTRLPAVTAFYYEHGIEFDLAAHEQRTHLLDYREELLEDDPIRFRITIPLDGDELSVTYDEQMSVVEVSR